MTKTFEEWLVEITKNENFALLEKLPEYLSSEYGKAADRKAERDRLAGYFENNVPRTPFSLLVLEAITTTK